MVFNLEKALRKAYPNVAINTVYLRIQKDTGISLSSMQRIMSGNTGPSIDTLSDLAHNLGCTLSDLFN